MRKIHNAYYAGIFDGEGTVALHPNTMRGKKHKTYQVVVQVINTNEWLCQQLCFSFGGAVGIHRRANDRCKQIFHWYASGKSAHQFLLIILPYSHLKRPQIELALQFIAHKKHGRIYSEKYFDIESDFKHFMLKLNQRGSVMQTQEVVRHED